MRFLVDEDMPRSLARTLSEAGIDAIDVRDAGLRGRADEEILEFAVREGMAVITGDVEFGNIVRFELGRHCGIIVVRFPNDAPVGQVNAAAVEAAESLNDEEVLGNVVIVAPDRIRIRRSSEVT